MLFQTPQNQATTLSSSKSLEKKTKYNQAIPLVFSEICNCRTYRDEFFQSLWLHWCETQAHIDEAYKIPVQMSSCYYRSELTEHLSLW